MASVFDDDFQIADGHDNTAGLEALHEINPPLFETFERRGTLLTEWSDFVERELGGDRQPVDIGLPSVRVMLELPVSVEEYAALIDLEGDVTVRVFNKSLGTWGNYNGVMVVDREKRTWGNDEWDRAQFEVFDLEAI